MHTPSHSMESGPNGLTKSIHRQNLLYGPARIVSFILNASINSLPTPDFLKIMNYIPDSAYAHALQTKRYTWRHDSVLAVLEKEIRAFMDKRNKLGVVVPSAPQLYSSFVRAMEGKPRSRNERQSNSERGTDWDMMVDTPSKLSLPSTCLVFTSNSKCNHIPSRSLSPSPICLASTQENCWSRESSSRSVSSKEILRL